MNTKVIHRAFGILAFAVALVTYLMTVQPTVPFWDCGEFTAAAVHQQVPHPPGAPLFLMVGKLFHLIPFGDPGWRVNLVSVFASAFTVWLLYLITVQVINHWRGSSQQSFSEAIATYGSAFIGATAYTFSDTFWFNAVESEVYAASTLFVALITWLMMRWSEEAEQPNNERYLLIIAYLMGLSTGVHLFSILTMFSIALIVYFRRYQFKLSTFILMGVLSVVAFGIIYPGIVKIIPSMLAGNLFRTEAHEYSIADNPAVILLALGIIGAAIFGVWYGTKNNKPVVNLACASFLLVLLGYSTYAHILIRSNARPPMNENAPNTFAKLTSYLNREQYGDAPSWPRRYQSGARFEDRHRKHGPWNPAPDKIVTRKDGQSLRVPDYSKQKTNFSGEMSYLFKYQFNHMYLRYFLWNFMGRTGDNQDAPATLFGTKRDMDYKAYTYGSGFADLFPIKFWGIPLLIGLVGMFFHFRKDPTIAFTYLVLFLMTGMLAAFAQNQQDPQPRERDYFYVASFMVWSMWIGIGVFAIIDSIRAARENVGVTGAVLAIGIIALPLNMGAGGWKIHSRAGNYIPFDFSYNVLQSLEKDAIVFTYGDNDTFPLWYMQDVAGVRRDVRVVNLSLGQTGWYINELKNLSPWGAKKIPLTFSDESLMVDETDPRSLAPTYGEAMPVTVEVNKDILAKFTGDPAIINRGTMQFMFTGDGNARQGEGGVRMYFMGVQHQLIRNIIETTKFERPVYFTPGTTEYCGLENYLRWEGLALRVCPVPQGGRMGESFNEEVMDQCLLNIDNSDNFSTTPKYGFKYRNLNNPDVYYDETARRFPDSYRISYLRYANYLINEKNDKKKAERVLDALDQNISPTMFPMGYTWEYQLSEMYKQIGANEKAKKYATILLTSVQQLMDTPKLIEYERFADQFSPFDAAAKAHMMLGNYDKAKEMLMMWQQQENNLRIRFEMDNIDVVKLENQGDYRGAMMKANEYMMKYSQDPQLQQIVSQWYIRLDDLRKKAGLGPTDSSQVVAGP
jgi:hypothetical protein